MAGFMSHNPSENRPAGQIQVADQIQYLVADALIDEAEFVVDWAFGRDNEKIARGQVMPQTAHPQLLGLVFEDKGPSWGDLFGKIFNAEVKREDLPAHRWGGFKVV